MKDLFSTSLAKNITLLSIQKDIVARKIYTINWSAIYDDKISYITINSKGKLTYLPPNKEFLRNDNGEWSLKNRQESKINKLFANVLREHNIDFIENDLTIFGTKLKALYNEGDFKIVRGTEIAHWYNYEQYSESETGTLSSSCMREQNENVFDIYTQNENVSMLILTDENNKLKGRAIIWNDLYMDRIYSNDITIESFKEYARENKLIYKTVQSYSSKTTWQNLNNETETIILKIELDTNFYSLPYLDTFQYVNDGFICNCNSLCDEDYKIASSTSGSYEESQPSIYDEISGDRIDEEDARYIESINGYTHIDNCIFDDINEEYILSSESVELRNGYVTHQNNEDVVYCESNDCYELIDDTFYCEYAEQHFSYHYNDSIYIDLLSMRVHSDYVTESMEKEGYIYIAELNRYVQEENLISI